MRISDWSSDCALPISGRIELKGLLQDIADSDRFSGPLPLYSDFATRGDSEAALVSNLSGDRTLTGTVTVAPKVEEHAGALVLDLLGQQVREIRGIADSAAMLFGAFACAPPPVARPCALEACLRHTAALTVPPPNP